MFRTFQTLSLTQAGSIVDKVIELATDDGGKPVSIAICGTFGQPVCAASMDGATLQSFPIAQNKAFTAISLGKNTVENATRVPPPDPGNYGDCRITTFPGGILIRCNDMIVGGLGVSGRKGNMETNDTIKQDHELAMAAYDWFIQTLA